MINGAEIYSDYENELEFLEGVDARNGGGELEEVPPLHLL